MKTIYEEEPQGITPHLDDDAFAELMMGGASSVKAQAHLEECARCRAEVSKFHASVGGFSMASLAWSEKKSDAMPGVPKSKLHSERKTSAKGSFYPAWSWSAAGLAVLLAIGVAVPVKMHFDAEREGQVAAAGAEEDASGLNSAEQIAKDNQLMADVQVELERSRAALVSQYDRKQSGADGHGAGKRTR